MHAFEEAQAEGRLNQASAAAHITKWTRILQDGPNTFGGQLGRERRKVTTTPLVFAIALRGVPTIGIAHGIDSIALDDDTHPMDGTGGFFLGDRIGITVDAEVTYQDPQFWTVAAFGRLADCYQGRTAADKDCLQADDNSDTATLLPVNKKTATVYVTKLLPMPIEWWGFFLSSARTPRDGYKWITAQTRTWTNGDEREAAQIARRWMRAACTSLDDSNESCVALPATPVAVDKEVATWIVHTLGRHLPKPKTAPTRAARPIPLGEAGHATIMQHAMSLAQDVIKASTERNDRDSEKVKTLPEPLLCRILGLSGLAWDEQHLMAPIWLQLRQQTDKPSKELVLRSFFQSLSAEATAFKQFRNSTLFDNILNCRFEPGPSYETCHHGISLLAVSMRSFAAQEKEKEEDSYFEAATNKTPDAVRKHHAKLPPPLPTTLAELIQLVWRLVVLTKGLFTDHCSLVVQLTDLHTELQEREQHILGNADEAADLIPQLAWAIISTSREFFGTICTRDDVDPPEGQAAICAIANLRIHTSMFKAGYRLNLANVPEQWQWRTRTPTQKQPRDTINKNDGDTGYKKEGPDKRYGSDPFRRTGGETDAKGNQPQHSGRV